MITVAIEGASGYSGIELTRILARHPGAELVGASSGRWAGRSLATQLGIAGATSALTYAEDLETFDAVDVVFLATPPAVSERLVPSWRERAGLVIDLSQAFRADPRAVYGLTEHRRDALATARLVANPGCYPTAIQLSLLPLIADGLLAEAGPVIVDAKSGVTGAGRRLDDSLLFNELADNHYPYKVGRHQHAPEIERGLGRPVIFTPHLLPTRRGLLTSAYVPVAPGVDATDLRASLAARYAPEPFVHLAEPDAGVGLASVVGTPCCRVAVGPTIEEGYARVFGSLDNLLKGAASQAVQNMNLALALDETTGLI